jgi:2-octaprenyl-6-methoxyphenol hydroxylase
MEDALKDKAVQEIFDVLIIGGGLVGGALAGAVDNRGLRAVLVDPRPLSQTPAAQVYDDRIIALAQGSRLILEQLGVWADIAHTPIHEIHVSDRGGFGFTRLHRRDMQLEALGYVCAARTIAQALQKKLASPRQLRFVRGEALSVNHHSDHAEVQLRDGQILRARLVVAADGTASALAQAAGCAVRYHDYAQTALIATLTPQHPHQFIAYERFTDSGPLALLPMAEQRCSLVWTVATQTAQDLCALPEKPLLQVLQQRFGWRLGRFLEITPPQAYPLRLRYLPQAVLPRLVFIGNAAHTLHPVAGQGLNLGLRDVAALSGLLHAGDDCGAASLLRNYGQARKTDLMVSVRLTDTLIKVFSNNTPSLAFARNAALLGLHVCPPLKSLFLRQTTGLF